MAPRTTLTPSVFLVAFITPWIAFPADLAAPAAYEGQRIVNVRFDPPGQPVASDDLNRLLTWKPGDALHLQDVRATIKRLYATGSFASIDVDTEPAQGGVEVVIRTTEQWFVGPVEAHGKMNDPPKSGQLADATQLELGQPFYDEDLNRAVDGMRGLLERNGLYHAQITPKVERDNAHQEVSITFDIDSGKRARLVLPDVTGDTKLGADAIAHDAKYKAWFRWKPATDSNVQEGIHNILNKYAKKKRLTAAVTLDKRTYDPAENRVHTAITANGGPVVKITAQEAKISQSKLKKYVPVFEEQSVNNDLLVTGARNLIDYFQFQGYFDVQVDYKISTPSADQEEITYRIGLGERHRVAAVVVKGNQYFETKDIRARMYTQPAGFVRLRHGRYSGSFAKRDIAAITALYQDSGFRGVKVIAATENNYKGKKGDVAVTYTIEEGPQYTVSTFDVTGLSLANKAAILKLLASVPGEPYSETNVAMDRDFILSKCNEAGYAAAQFDFRATPVPGENRMALEYDLTMGPYQTVRDVVITGLHTTRRRLINPTIPFKPGDPLSWNAMGNMQRELYNLGVFEKVDMAIQDPDGKMQDK